MKYINLTQGKKAMVDDEDFEELNKVKWCFSDGYAIRRYTNEQGSSVYTKMHRFIINTPNKMDTDHINHNKLDNRKSNLRICTRTENQQNHKIQKNSTSGYKGVNYHKVNQVWRAQIRINRKHTHLGCFDTKEEAAIAYNQAAIKYFGEFAYLNKVLT